MQPPILCHVCDRTTTTCLKQAIENVRFWGCVIRTPLYPLGLALLSERDRGMLAKEAAGSPPGFVVANRRATRCLWRCALHPLRLPSRHHRPAPLRTALGKNASNPAPSADDDEAKP
jgi:hypothetical protein